MIQSTVRERWIAKFEVDLFKFRWLMTMNKSPNQKLYAIYLLSWSLLRIYKRNLFRMNIYIEQRISSMECPAIEIGRWLLALSKTHRKQMIIRAINKLSYPNLDLYKLQVALFQKLFNKKSSWNRERPKKLNDTKQRSIHPLFYSQKRLFTFFMLLEQIPF